jgi:hypothetical protein
MAYSSPSLRALFLANYSIFLSSLLTTATSWRLDFYLTSQVDHHHPRCPSLFALKEEYHLHQFMPLILQYRLRVRLSDLTFNFHISFP